MEEGFGLFWTGPVAGSNEVLAKIPEACLINVSNVRKYALEEEVFSKLLSALEGVYARELNERETLMTFLIYEQFLRRFQESSGEKDSPWKAYLDILPKKSTTPVFYTPQARGWLEGTAVGEATEAKIKRLELEYEKFLLILAEDTPLSFEEFAWADNMYWSRVISFQSALQSGDAGRAERDEDCHLVPFIDLCNHSLTPAAHWEITEHGIDLVQVGEQLDTDSEIHISYGEKPNNELLYLHGFIIPENPCVQYMIPLPLIPDELVRSKVGFLKALNISPQLVLTPSDMLDDFTEDTWQLLCLCMVNEEDDFGEDEVGNFCYRNSPVTTLKEVAEAVATLPNFKIIQLRAITVLYDILNALIYTLRETKPSADEEIPGELQLIYEYVLTYRDEEASFLETFLEILGERQQELIEDEQVQVYLALNQ
ncbi:SET domain-containing protein [Basidiobolus meristosporus CBS 931.73]|uniref:SET domain-containing protein n=1 Tax=Basidiobolus meristosporus CBS 931.73 TaxID=1314790 RepID=A0A1Y1Z5U3_9FUNG|nr:SET domain-containing protein [Basidiobolus meristosporus CBS 931.73]|eukprot:ORY05619.1 SET domain-containing protein [Basidiobolus meristosporus CBS 931.73]